MELGRGQWGSDPAELAGLRDNFLDHMRGYDRILVLRYFQKRPDHSYELIEVPKALLAEAAHGELAMMLASRQFPKPGERKAPSPADPERKIYVCPMPSGASPRTLR